MPGPQVAGARGIDGGARAGAGRRGRYSLCVYLCVYIYIYIYTYVCMYVCMYVYIYIYIYIMYSPCPAFGLTIIIARRPPRELTSSSPRPPRPSAWAGRT